MRDTDQNGNNDGPSDGDAAPSALPQVAYLEERRVTRAERDRVLSQDRRIELWRRIADAARFPLHDSRLGFPYLEQARRHHGLLLSEVHDDIQRGASVHRRPPWLVRQIPWTVAVLDGLILYTFCADVFNVPPGGWSTQRAVAAMLALLGSGITYTWLSVTGTQLRNWRDELGEVQWALTGPVTRLMLLISGIVTASLAVLMYHRIVEEASAAAVVGYLTTDVVHATAVVFATLSAAANLAVVAVHLLDGSREAEELRHVGRLVYRADRAREQDQRRAWRRTRR